LPLGIIIDNQYKKRLIQNKRYEMMNELNKYSILLTNIINGRFSLLTALEIFVKNNWDNGIDENDFNKFAQGLHSTSGGIRNFIIAPDGVNKYVYPLEDNQEAIGHNLINDDRENVRKDVQKTINTKKVAISGPYELRQGGQGIILRKALFENNEFWGLVTMALDMNPIYEFLGLNKGENLRINISLKREDNIFYGPKEVFNSNPVSYKINFKGGQFTIAAVPKNGWSNSIKGELKLSRLFVLSIIIFLAIITYLLTYRDQKIRALVMSRTQELKEMNDILKEKEKVIRNKAYNDHLTGLYNRRYFENELKRLDSSRKYPIAIIIGDLDGLKDVNDNYGHKKGDEYIINAADILKSTIRTEDIIARIGGDEFAIILPKTNYKEAQSLCQRIQINIEEFNKDKKLVKPLSISLGFEVMENNSQNLNEIFNKADQKMYINKGRK
jgi:diguanylate cyclase (GGDEF)-like protein